MWVQWQLIPTYGAVKWSYFKSSYGHPMLVVANTKAQPTILTYDPLRGLFKPTAEQGNINLTSIWMLPFIMLATGLQSSHVLALVN